MQVPWTHYEVMNANVVLALIISHILLSWVPLNEVVSLIHLVCHPEIPHLHEARSLSFDGVVGYTDCCFVVAVHWCGRLWVAKFLEDEAEDFSFFAIEEEGT